MNDKTVNNEVYFATLPARDLAEQMQVKRRLWVQHCKSNGWIDLWKKKLINYYGISAGGNSSQSVNAGGSEGELSLIKVNDLHNLVQNQLTMVTSQRPAGIARAINSDTKSLKASRMGSAIAEFYMTKANGGFEIKFVSATECALLCDEGFLEIYWDKSAGDPIAVDQENGVPVMSGDALLRTHGPWNVSRDTGLTTENQDWYILTYRANRYNYAKMYPRFEEQILRCGYGDETGVPMNNIPEGSDALWCHLLVHNRTAAVPNGRYSLLIGDDIVLDTDLPFRDFPVERIAPSDVIDGNMGYASANDILALEETTDALHSIIVTNQTSFGGQSIVGPTGANLKVTDLAKGVRYFELAPDLVDKLKPLQMTQTPAEIFNYIQMLGTKKEQAVGSNSVVRGQPEGALAGASGSAFALITAQAIAFNSGIQRAYFKCLSNVMTKTIGVLQTYADTPRVATIVGKHKAAGLKEFKFTGKDLGSISSIVYELVNPMAQSFGGRLTFAQDLLKAGQIKSPKQYITLATTGQPDALTEDDEADGMLILEENEWLMEGKPFRPVITQIHADHIKSHTSQITLEMQESEPDFVARVLDHIQQHIDLWMTASVQNPGILLATGQQPLFPPQPPGMPPAQPGAPTGGAMMGGETPPAVQEADGIKKPELPMVAGTQQRAQVPGVTDNPAA